MRNRMPRDKAAAMGLSDIEATFLRNKDMKIALALSAVMLPFGITAQAHEDDAAAVISYDDALQCTALMAVFTVVFEEEKDEGMVAIFDDLLTRWSMVAALRGEAVGKHADKDIGGATESLGKEISELDDDEAATEKLFEERGDKCMDLLEANQAEFDAINVDEINEDEGNDAG